MPEIKNLGQLLTSLAAKAGLAATDPNLVNLLSNAELTKVTLHSDIVKALDENLLSVDAAKDNHPVIGPKYKAEALSPVDRTIEAWMEEFGFDDASKSELKGVASSYKRLEKIGAKLKELSSKKDNADAGKEKNALQKQVDDLLGKLQSEKATYDSELKKLQDERTADKIGFEKKSLYGPLKTIYDTLDPSVRTTSIDAIINKALQDKEAEFAYDENGSFIVRRKDGTNLLGANHTKYTPQSLIDEILATNKILAVNGNNQQQHQQQQQQQNTQQHSQKVDATTGQPITGTNQSVTDFNLLAATSMGEAGSAQ